MIEIRIPKEITEYKETFLFGLTIRRFVCLAVTLVICVPLYIFGKEVIPEDILAWIIILIAVPIMAFGWFTYHGMNFETFAKCVIQFYMENQKRPYIELNTFWYAREEIIANDIARQKAEEIKKSDKEMKNDVRKKK